MKENLSSHEKQKKTIPSNLTQLKQTLQAQKDRQRYNRRNYVDQSTNTIIPPLLDKTVFK